MNNTYGIPRIAVYAATKHAVKGLTEALSVEWQRHNVRVADVLPGLIDTAILVDTKNHSKDAPQAASSSSRPYRWTTARPPACPPARPTTRSWAWWRR